MLVCLHRFAKQIKSGTLTETKPIHLSLFETIKLAAAPDESNDADAVEPEEKPKEETTVPMIENGARRKEPEISSPIRSCISFLSNSFWSLPKEYQLLSGVLFIGSVWAWSRGGASESQQIAALNQKVDQLNGELIEIKALLQTIAQSMSGDDQRLKTEL
jgi:hypothetical protein